MADATATLSMTAFWEWLIQHPNCILRAGTQDSVLFDDEDLHWHMASDRPEEMLVQVIRGKHLVGELRLSAPQVSYVQGSPGEQEGEYLFELISESDNDRVAAYFFVLSHGYEAAEPPPRSRIH